MVRPITYAEFCRRCEKQGRSQHWFYKAHPDPVIRDYCMISKAEEKWRFIEKRLHGKTARVAEIEALLASSKGKAPQTLMDELHHLYRWTFNAFKIKGIVEESRTDRTPDEPSLTILPQAGVPAAELRHILEKVRTLPPLKEKENILVCDPLLPMFDRASGSLRLFHILKALVQMGHHVTFISRDSDHAERYVPILRDLGIETYAGDPAAKEHAGALLIAPFVDLEDILRKRPYKAAILSFWHLAEYYLPLIREHSPGTAVIVDSVDIHFLREIREAELKEDDRLKAQALENKEREIAVYGKADRVWVVTPDDRSAIQPLVPEVPIDIIPNIHERIEDTKSFENTSDLLFVGNFNHRPNIDSVEFLCDEILPLLQTELPGVKTYIVGNNPPEAVRKRATDRIVVTGYVEQLAPYLKTARISLSPLRYGAGMKGKVGEALSWGLPVVTTSIGAEGMGLVDGHDALIADDPQSFAKHVARLYRDRDLWMRLSRNGRQTVESQWSPEAIRKRLSGVLREIEGNNERVSLVILTFNELEYTKRCVESVGRHTPEAHEIVFVDNGSTDGTVRWLRQFVKEHQHCRLIENGRNYGFAKGCNQGIRAAAGDYILLLNNDTVVTDGWLAGMMECLKRVSDAGIVGPMTNHISGTQKVQRVGYETLEGLEAYARAFRTTNRHRRIETRRLVGFCMLFRKSLIDEIGLLDESFGTGNFEDDDLCARAALAGYRNVIAGDVFIHHFGSRSFIGNRIDYGSAITGNRRVFADKWRALEQKAGEGRAIRCLVAREQARERFLRVDVGAAVDLGLTAIRNCPGDPRAYHDLADHLIRADRCQEALDVLREAPPASAVAEKIVLEALARNGQGEREKAAALADQALAADSACARALNLKGVLAFEQGAHDKATSFFEKAAGEDPAWGEPLTNLGVLAWSAGRTEEAFDLLEKGFILSPHLCDLAERYHTAAVALGLQCRAETVFREARDLHPASRPIAFLLIDLLIAQEKFHEAMSEIEAAMAAFDADGGFIDAALEVRRRIGTPEIDRHAGRPTLSLCMIVKDEQPNLVRCLSSVKAAVDEIVVVDTGSTDRTKDLAAVFGAKVYDARWSDDFAEARNTALSKATGDWILVLDADEAVSAADGLTLKGLVEEAARRKAPAGWLVTTRTYTTDMTLEGWTANDGAYGAQEAATGWFPSSKVRLFRNDPRIRYEGAVHEMLEPSMKRAGLAWLPCGVIVHHYGYAPDGGGRPSKRDAYYRLGKKKVEQTGGDPRAIYELAVQASRLKKYSEAVDLWQRYLSAGVSEDLHLAWLNLGHALIETGLYEEALVACRKALAIAPAIKEASLNAALCEFYTGQRGAAVERLQTLLAATAEYPPAEALLSSACLLEGRHDQAACLIEALRRRGLSAAPFYQVHAHRLRRIGRAKDAEILYQAARQMWSQTLAEEGIRPSDESIDAAMEAAVPDSMAKALPSDPDTPRKPALSLCMIVRNEERRIARALESVKALADEMIVVDTGSTDQTREIAAAMGANVFEDVWTEDFSQARNISLSKATGDWVLILDADESISTRDHGRLRELIRTNPAGADGYDLTTRNYVHEPNTSGWTANDGSYAGEEAGTGWYPNRKVRLFRNDPRIRFSGAVHELVEGSMIDAGLKIAACDIPVHHTGKLERSSVLEKGESYYRIGVKKVEETGGTPRAILELAIQAGELGRFEDAIMLWKRYLDGKPAKDVARAYVNLIHACLHADRFDDALVEARRAAALVKGSRELQLNCAAAELFAGDIRKAVRMAEQLLRKDPAYPPALVLLAVCHILSGNERKGVEPLRRLRERGIEAYTLIRPIIGRLRKAGKDIQAAQLTAVMDRQSAAGSEEIPPRPGTHRKGIGSSLQR
jgi:glycosyltransferase involved in cell wall biosynthesis/Tfp pilus assembly protein PilF